MTLTANGPNFGYDMSLQANGPLVFHGDKGYSVKSEQGQASYYYSQPFFKIDGMLKLPTGNIEVVGNAWLDHEWSSQPLSDDQLGLGLVLVIVRGWCKADGFSTTTNRWITLQFFNLDHT